MKNFPRIMLCAAKSGGGKTTVTCAVLQALVNRGKNPIAFKCGPDYIDPMFHSRVIGAKSRNLDLFLMGSEITKNLFYNNSKLGEISVVEGVMGYYDGIAMGSYASSWDLAKRTLTPAVLIIDARGRSRSAAAEIHGFLNFENPSMIKGVILNRVSPMLYPRMAEMITEATGLHVYGYLPEMPECVIESRHLGLITANEISDLKEKLNQMANVAEKTIDINGLIELANSAEAINIKSQPEIEPIEDKVKIAIAKDAAFCFYYEDAINLLKKIGAEIVEFSPLGDSKLPKDCSGIYIGGGYPELYAKQLSENKTMLKSIANAVDNKMPTIAECGGFMYLCKSMEDINGKTYPMAGVIDGKAYKTEQLKRFGYIKITAKKDGLLSEKGSELCGHEFHYWDCDKSGEDFIAEKPQSNKKWDCAYSSDSLYAGYPHFHLCSRPESAKRFVNAASVWSTKNSGGLTI